MSARGGFKGQCSSCGWTTKRHLKNMQRPCPKCGGSMYIHDDDKDEAVFVAVVSLGGLLAIAVVFHILGIGK